MWTRKQLKTNGKAAFRRNYWPSVAVAFLASIFMTGGIYSAGSSYSGDTGEASIDLTGVSSSVLLAALGIVLLIAVVFAVLWLLVGTAFEVGSCRFFVQNQTEKAPVRTILFGFRSGHYGHIVLTLFLRSLYLTLWGLLFVIPGIYKYYEYLMIPYILADNPDMPRRDAFAISKRMMYGEKWHTFVLSLSFILWDVLSAVTFGLVGIFYVEPYKRATYAELYAANKAKAYHEGYIE